MKDISEYILDFTRLKRAHQYGGAPHKPILLLAILEGVARGEIITNSVFITPELILCFKEYWFNLVNTPHQLNFALPFYHLRTEAFWKLVCKPGYEIALTTSHSIKSLSSLNDSLVCAEIEKELFDFMKDPTTNKILKMVLLENYFPDAKNVNIEYNLFKNIEQQILNEDQEKYKARIQELNNNLSKEQVEEELFVRGSLFKREIPRIYNFTCAISRMRVISLSNAQMVDACHIVPFSISKDDTIRNGVSLSPNLHRAFDRGLISISPEFTVLLSPQVKEEVSPFALSQFAGLKIMLPTNPTYFPNQDNLEWHRKHRLLL